ncbi:bacteriorhodopsin [Rhizobium sp. BK313]|jgi:bacteriorhodopsin|uniref:bacteriorhodopsin n=1 Tax=Rhizobium sp. BK313 TaxID=2587081 RepID=UPI00105DC096|nr:bacteriorhodopsin [Rhizobium sp. BK313]MBB3457995.1 bacteriorhodopsin [Rhizobium sp. BK313]
MAVYQTTDLTAASYSVALFGLAATTVLLLLGTSWVGRNWRLPVSLCAIAALVGIPAAFEARNAWLAGGGVPVVYHYVGWAVSMPVQVMALFFLAKTAGKLGAGLFWRLIVVAELMVFVRYLGEAQFMHPTLAFLIGLVFWLYILGELYFGRMDDVVRASTGDYLRRGYFWLRLIVTIGWAIYPLGNFLTAFAGMTDDGSLSVAYNVADILNRMAFGIAILATGVLASEETNNA